MKPFRRVSKLVRLVWPLCGGLAACGSDQPLDPVPGEAGSGGTGECSGCAGAEVGGGSAGRATGGRAAAGNGSGTGSAGGSSAAAGDGNGGGTAGAAGQGGAQTGAMGGASGEASGGTAAGQGGGGAGGGPSDGLPFASSFTRLTLRRFESAPTWTGDCRDEFVSEWSLDRETRTLAWNFCKLSEATVQIGSDTLSEAELQSVLNAVSQVKRTEPFSSCTADAGGIEIELEVDGMVSVYENDDGCEPRPRDPSAVIGYPGLLFEWIEWRSGGEIPPMPRRLRLFTGESPPPTERDCWDPPYPIEYDLDLETGEVSYSWCEEDPETGDFVDPAPSATRVLDAGAIAAVRDAYAGLELGASAACDSLMAIEAESDGSVRVPRITVNDDVVLLDEAASCSPRGYTSGGLAIGVAALTHLVADGLTR